jgi:hypothetical protein
MAIADYFKPKWKHSDCEIRRAAVSRLTDQTLLAKIAKNDKDSVVRKTAENRKEALLAEIARNNSDCMAAKAAVEMLTDQTLLAEIAKKVHFDEVRYIAVRRLLGEAILADLAKNDKDRVVRRVAVENMGSTNQRLLAEISQNDNDGYVRQAAFQKLTDQTLLDKISVSKRPVNAPCRICENPVSPAYRHVIQALDKKVREPGERTAALLRRASASGMRVGNTIALGLPGVRLNHEDSGRDTVQCCSCKKYLVRIDMNRGALQAGAPLPILYDGVVCQTPNIYATHSDGTSYGCGIFCTDCHTRSLTRIVF